MMSLKRRTISSTDARWTTGMVQRAKKTTNPNSPLRLLNPIGTETMEEITTIRGMTTLHNSMPTIPIPMVDTTTTSTAVTNCCLAKEKAKVSSAAGKEKEKENDSEKEKAKAKASEVPNGIQTPLTLVRVPTEKEKARDAEKEKEKEKAFVEKAEKDLAKAIPLPPCLTLRQQEPTNITTKVLKHKFSKERQKDLADVQNADLDGTQRTTAPRTSDKQLLVEDESDLLASSQDNDNNLCVQPAAE